MSNKNKLSTAPAGAVAQKTAGGGALSVFADGASFNTALRMAQCLASSTVVPKEYHGNVGNCMIAIEMASRINTSPMMVMQNLYIVNGRPAWSSQWIIAMINSSRRYKTELQFEFGRDKADGGLSCRAWAEDYSGHKVYGPKITMNMANDEGWTSKNGSKWKTMPDVMIQYRAASFFGRMNCPDMITMRWGSHPITSSTAIIWATRTRRTNRSPAVATPFARRWLRLLQGPTSPNTSPKWATPSRQWPPCWTWWRCRKEQRHGQKEIDGAGRAVSVQG